MTAHAHRGVLIDAPADEASPTKISKHSIRSLPQNFSPFHPVPSSVQLCSRTNGNCSLCLALPLLLQVFDPFRAFDWEDRRLDGCAILPYRAPGSPPEPEDITSVQVLGSTREIGAIRHITFPNGCILPETMVALDLVQRTCVPQCGTAGDSLSTFHSAFFSGFQGFSLSAYLF